MANISCQELSASPLVLLVAHESEDSNGISLRLKCEVTRTRPRGIRGLLRLVSMGSGPLTDEQAAVYAPLSEPPLAKAAFEHMRDWYPSIACPCVITGAFRSTDGTEPATYRFG